MAIRMKWTSVGAAFALTALLAGCGSGDGQGAATNTVTEAGASAQSANGAEGVGMPERAGDLMGKIVSVTADSVVIQKSNVQPSDMPGGDMGEGRRPNGQAPEGSAPQAGGGSGDALPAQDGNPGADAPAGDGAQGQQGGPGGEPPADGQGQRPQGGRGGFGQMEFTDEQVTVTLNSETAISAMSFGQDGMSNTPMEASALKAGDIVTVWLNPDQTTAQSLQVRSMPANNGEAGEQQ
ncbi:hypothetical protein [Paenibacillus methanolicus]|uniref:DUF5666 domain-containing protein n=1 Tax=Paenibacillus methanolicus TaxID=582686 RepID=A0A5S5BXS1_9BACL|nr:hypothetical protein [Paenibacillus methanolicus]TYP71837.1 hypothetical protein BCM02_109115 [Paenibacillus methanolicus]